MIAITKLESYLQFLSQIAYISKYPIDDINFLAGFLRLQDLCLYEPYLQYTLEKTLKKKKEKIRNQKMNLEIISSYIY